MKTLRVSCITNKIKTWIAFALYADPNINDRKKALRSTSWWLELKNAIDGRCQLCQGRTQNEMTLITGI